MFHIYNNISISIIACYKIEIFVKYTCVDIRAGKSQAHANIVFTKLYRNRIGSPRPPKRLYRSSKGSKLPSHLLKRNSLTRSVT